MDQDQCKLHGAGWVNGSVFLLVITTDKDTVLCECGRSCQLVPSARQNWSVAEHSDRFNHKPCSAVVSGMFQLTQLSSHCGCLLLTYPLVHTTYINFLSAQVLFVIWHLDQALHNLGISLFSTKLLEETPARFAHITPTRFALSSAWITLPFYLECIRLRPQIDLCV